MTNTQNILINKVEQELNKISANIPYVKSVYLIGSIITDEFNKNSDIDLLVNFSDLSNNDFYRIERSISSITGRDVQVIIRNSCDPLFLKLNPNKRKVYVNKKNTGNSIKRRKAVAVY